MGMQSQQALARMIAEAEMRCGKCSSHATAALLVRLRLLRFAPARYPFSAYIFSFLFMFFFSILASCALPYPRAFSQRFFTIFAFHFPSVDFSIISRYVPFSP
eukprot:6194811-Pleurochrysis_carterae.AAC.2